MKSLLVATTAVALISAAPAFAQDRAGSVGLSAGQTMLSIDDSDVDADVWAVDSVVALPVSSWTVTLEGVAEKADSDFTDATVGGGGAHLSRLWRPDVRVGGFVAADGLGDGVEAFTGGVEVQKYFSRAMVTGQLAYSSADDIDTDFWTVGAEGVLYGTPTLRFHAGAAFNAVDTAGQDDEAWVYRAGAEYRLAKTPFVLAGEFSRTEIEPIEVDTWTVGLRYNFGGGFQTRDRAGGALRFHPLMRPLNRFGGNNQDGGDDGDDGGPGGPV